MYICMYVYIYIYIYTHRITSRTTPTSRIIQYRLHLRLKRLFDLDLHCFGTMWNDCGA